jgi:Winged helix DNA-binding domain
VAERFLTLRELNRTTLMRQLLLRRRSLSPRGAIERLAGLQAQWSPSPYLALWSRLEGFRRDQLERALRRDAVLKATLMRATLHLVSARDYAFFASAVREAQTVARTRGVEPPPQAAVERAAALAAERPLTRRELLAVLGHEERIDPMVDPRPLRQLHWLLVLAGLDQTPDSAMWTPARVARFRNPGIPLAPLPEALERLVVRYLAAFGPASRADAATWSGVPVRDLATPFDSLALRRFRDELGRELFDLPRAPIAAADVPAPPRLLPRWDNLLLAHKDRRRVLPDGYRMTVIRKNGDVQPTFLVDGFVAGLWREQNGKIVLEPFEPLPRTARRELETEARRLETWLER